MLSKMLIHNTLSLIMIAALLFLPAGTLDWPNAWVFLIGFIISSYASGFWLLRHDPALLNERLKPPIQRGQKGWDKILMVIFLAMFFIWVPLMALDARRYQLSHVPFYLQVLGGAGAILCMYICYLTFRENTYAAPVVKIQKQREQKVIKTGPYRYVRHPMYGGLLFFFAGVPLLLGSWWGLLWGGLLAVMLGVRATMEENTLKQELAGYVDYAARVRYRFIPYVW